MTKKEEKRSVGRPPRNKEALTEDLHIRLDGTEHDKLKAWCVKKKLSKTDAVREGLRLLGALK